MVGALGSFLLTLAFIIAGFDKKGAQLASKGLLICAAFCFFLNLIEQVKK